ncbi:MAG: serine/threonine-protein kinase [Gemmataceae bacterium]
MSTNVEAIGDYELVERIAGGSMSTVFKGRQRETGDIVAVKIFGGELAQNPVLAQRFMQEIRTAKSLKHPHIVRGLDHGLDGDKLFLVMEYIDGPSLGDRIEKEGKIPEAEAVQITVQIAEALHAAHQLGIIHRDVKPDNILLGPDGAKLTDLGLLKDLGADLDLTRPTKGLGTPNFMAPEQFDNAKNADVRCDVYSLAATLYMAVTGVLPFEGRASHIVWKRKVTHDFKPASQLVPGISEQLDKAVCHALAANPDHRPPTCPDFIRELVDGIVVAPPPPPSEDDSDEDSGAPLKFDRRVTVRFPSTRKGMCRTIGDDEFCWAGKVHDISAGGLCLILSRRFEPATVLAVEVHATDHKFSHVLMVRVVRVQPHTKQLWNVGCVFARSLSEIEVEDLL